MMTAMANPRDELGQVLQRIRGNQLAAQKAAAAMSAAIRGYPPPAPATAPDQQEQAEQ